MRMPNVIARILGSIQKIKRFAKSAKNRRPKHDDDSIWTPEQPDGVFTGVIIDERSSQKPRFRLLRKEDVVNAVRRIRNKPYRRFESQQPNDDEKKRVRFELPKDSPATKEKRKNKRMRSIRKHAKLAVEYLALGVASSAAGYGMPPGFNPNAFRPTNQSYEYPETYTVQQLRWLAQQRKDLYALANTGMM